MYPKDHRVPQGALQRSCPLAKEERHRGVSERYQLCSDKTSMNPSEISHKLKERSIVVRTQRNFCVYGGSTGTKRRVLKELENIL
jgi:hypothetical protein